MAILVTGGAGYIGSVTVELLRTHGEHLVVLDDLVRGHREAVHPSVTLYQGKVGNRELLMKVLGEHRIDECIHFGAMAYVGESVEQPARYFANNVAESLAMADCLMKGGVRRIVFSSTCAIYGEPSMVPIDESQSANPTNPYGWSKLFFERVLAAYDVAYGLRHFALRYFNAAGATETHGEHHDPETHLIPLALRVATGALPDLSVFGTDYPTPDGSAIRDYIHVQDLARAHSLALDHLRRGGRSEHANLGTGRGFSVLQVIDAVRSVTGKAVPFRSQPRRPGDPANLVASAAKARKVLGWTPEYLEIESIIETAWHWLQRHPRGYAERGQS